MKFKIFCKKLKKNVFANSLGNGDPGVCEGCGESTIFNHDFEKEDE